MCVYTNIHVFLSYSHKDKKEILAVRKALMTEGVLEENIFLDIYSIVPGVDWEFEIIKGIEKANLCLFLWTNNIDGSENVKSEREQSNVLMKKFEFKNRGLIDGSLPRPYYIVDIVDESLKSTLKERLGKYNSYQQIRFDNRIRLEEPICVNIRQKLRQTLQMIQNVYSQKDKKIGSKISPNNKEMKRGKIKKFMEIALHLVDQHQYTQALFLCKEIKKEVVRDPDILAQVDKITLDVFINRIYRLMGKFGKASIGYEELLERYREFWKSDFHSVLIIMSELAGTYRDQGNYKKAQELYEEIRTKSERTMGNDHPQTLISMDELANIYRVQKDYKKAQELYEKAILKWKEQDESDIDILRTMHHLAEVYQDEGNYKRAQEIHEKVSIKCENTLGKDHLLTLTSMNSLAHVYRVTKRYKEAQDLCRKVRKRSESTHGKYHEITIASMGCLSDTYRDRKKYGKSKELYKEIIIRCNNASGENHPTTLSYFNNLAAVYRALGEYKKASDIYQRVIKRGRTTLKITHPIISRSTCNLAELYRSQKNYKQAQLVLEAIREEMKNSLKPNHPDVIMVESYLLWIYLDQFYFEDAQNLYEEIMVNLNDSTDSEQKSINELKSTYKIQLNFQKAQQMYKKVLNRLGM